MKRIYSKFYFVAFNSVYYFWNFKLRDNKIIDEGKKEQR